VDDEEDRKIDEEEVDEEFLMKMTKERDNDTNDGGKTFGKYKVQCFYCKRFGHSQSNCWEKQNQQDEFSMRKRDMWTLFFCLVIQ
jgi:hypothetical protein